MSIETIDRLVDEERARDARAEVDRLLDGSPDPELRWRLELRRARLVLDDPDTPCNDALLAVDALLAEGAPVHAPEVSRAHALRIDGLGRTRCRDLALEAARTARESVGGAPDVSVAEGRLALAFDDRPRARQLFDEALAGDAGHAEAQLALANLLYVLGDFDGCHKRLDALDGGGRTAAAAWRLRAACHAARDDHDAEAEAWRRVREAVPESDRAGSDRVALALALAAAGRRPDALEELRAVWRALPDTGVGRYARKRIEHLERAPDGASKRLKAFPTVAQKWNYCGPAVLELCFRYLGLDMRQEEIADAVKREHGTPMFEIGAFLRRHGLVARRIAATPERLRAAIDLGLPVIVQEEYSTTSHVAVITGYDEALGVFLSADPATHRPVIKPFEWTERAGDLFGSGGLLVLGREGPDTEALAEKADAAGLVEESHLLLLDRTSELRPRLGDGGGVEEAAAEEVLRLCEEALSHDGRFKLAWHRRTWARLSLHQRHNRPDTRAALLRDLYVVRSSFPDDEWPHQLHGRWLLDEGRYDEAFVAYFEAWRRDPDDADDLQYMGEAKWLSGDLGGAEENLLRALAAEAHHARAPENLAAVYVRQLQDLDGADGDALWGTPPTLPPTQVRRPVERDPEDVARRAAHFSRIACSHHPGNPFNHEVAGFLRAREGDLEGAAAALRRAREVDPGRPWSVFQLGRVLERMESHDEARTLLEQATERFASMPTPWLELGRLHDGRGDPEAATAVLLRGIEAVSGGRAQLVGPLFHTLARAESGEAAAARLREVAEAHLGDGELLREVAHLLDRKRQRGHAIALLRHVTETAPGDVSSLYRLGQLLAEDLLTRDEGRAMLERVMERVPESPRPRVQLAWHLLGEDPAAGLALLEPVRDQEDPSVYDAEAALLEAMDRTDEADRALRRALDAYGSPVHGLVSLCWRHIDANRYDRAVRLAQRLDASDVPEDLRDHAETVWLTAHRLAGRVREILPRLSERCADGVPEHLSWEVYWATRSFDHALAAKAALVQAEGEEDPDERLEWRIHAAQELAEAGDPAMLEEVAGEAGDNASAWAYLAWAFAAVERFDEANDAARRAMEIDPEDRDALTAMQEVHVRLGDLPAAIGCAERLLELHPYEHQGAERLGILLGKSMDVERALAYSLRAVDAAPFCHVSQRSRAIALFAAGDLEGALRHAKRAADLEAPDPKAPEEEEQIRLAIEGDAEGLERCFAAHDRHGFPDVFPQWRARLREVASGAFDS